MILLITTAHKYSRCDAPTRPCSDKYDSILLNWLRIVMDSKVVVSIDIYCSKVPIIASRFVGDNQWYKTSNKIAIYKKEKMKSHAHFLLCLCLILR